MFSAPLINLLMIVFTPLTLLFTGLKKLLAKLLKTDSNRKVTAEELLMFVDEVEQGGSINENEAPCSAAQSSLTTCRLKTF